MSLDLLTNRSVLDANSRELVQYSTFYVSGRLYGIDVTRVQEVVKPMDMTNIPLAPNYIRGLINLRGQVATAIDLRSFLGLPAGESKNLMNVVCKNKGNMYALLVDEIGDVMEICKSSYEPTPQTIDESIRKHLAGVYKTDGHLLSILDIDMIAKSLN